MEQESIRIDRTPEFNAVARKLSDFIKSLPLSTDQNDRLVWLMIDQVEQAERDAFKQGFLMGVKVMKELGQDGADQTKVTTAGTVAELPDIDSISTKQSSVKVLEDYRAYKANLDFSPDDQ